jgi:putative membrane protein
MSQRRSPVFGVLRGLVGAGSLVIPMLAHAHDGVPAMPTRWWELWSWDPGTVALLFLAGALYASGLRALRWATRAPRKLRREGFYYMSGWLLLCVALLSPLHPWGSLLFSAHMTQHELLMVAAAPLLILGRPEIVLPFAFPRGVVRALLSTARQIGAMQAWRGLTHPLIAWLLHAIALWIWHVPALFEATLEREWVHALQHASFLGTALLFWHAVFHGRQRRTGYGLAVLNLFTTALHSGALGALLTFSSHPWYPAYAARAGSLGLTALEDQQLGGVIMWIPAGLVYVVAGLALFAGWLHESDRRHAALAAKRVPLSCARSS